MNTFLLILVTVIWGSTFFIIKTTIISMNPWLLIAGRLTIAALPMVSYIILKYPDKMKNTLAPRYGFILGTLLFLIYSTQTIGLKFTSSGHSAFITGTAIILVPLILSVFFHYKIKKTDIVSIIVVFCGLTLLTFHSDSTLNPGDILTMVTALVCSLHIIFSGQFVRHTEPLAMITWQFLTAATLSILLFLFSENLTLNVSLKAWNALIYLGLIGTLFCYFVPIWVQQKESSLKVAVIFSLEPVFAVLFAWTFNNETLNIREIVGACLILAGVFIYQIFHYYKKSH